MNLFVHPVAPGRSRVFFKVITNVESKYAKVLLTRSSPPQSICAVNTVYIDFACFEHVVLLDRVTLFCNPVESPWPLMRSEHCYSQQLLEISSSEGMSFRRTSVKCSLWNAFVVVDGGADTAMAGPRHQEQCIRRGQHFPAHAGAHSGSGGKGGGGLMEQELLHAYAERQVRQKLELPSMHVPVSIQGIGYGYWIGSSPFQVRQCF